MVTIIKFVEVQTSSQILEPFVSFWMKFSMALSLKKFKRVAESTFIKIEQNKDDARAAHPS